MERRKDYKVGFTAAHRLYLSQTSEIKLLSSLTTGEKLWVEDETL